MAYRVYNYFFGSPPQEKIDDVLLPGDDMRSDTWNPLPHLRRRALNTFVEGRLDSFLPFLGDYLLSYMADREQHDAVTFHVVEAWDDVWPDVEADLRWKLRLKFGVETENDSIMHTMRLRRWPKHSPPFWPRVSKWPRRKTWRNKARYLTGRVRTLFTKLRPLTAARAALLHACFPADQQVRPSVYYAMVIVNSVVVCQLCNWAMLLRFALIDRSDEYQLASFIIANKAYHFLVYGLIQLAQNAAIYFNCVLTDVGARHPCANTAPGRELGYWRDFTMELVRLCCVWYAFFLLRSSKGGNEQAFELERKRLGIMAGSASAERLKRLIVPEGAPKRQRGGCLRFLWAPDFCAYGFCLTAGLLNLFRHIASLDCNQINCREFLKSEHGILTEIFGKESILVDWRFWMTLDFSETCYSLLLVPFVLLQLEPFKRYFTHAKPTGYDRYGRLCWSLGAYEIAQLDEQRAREEAEDRAASAIQGLWTRRRSTFEAASD